MPPGEHDQRLGRRAAAGAGAPAYSPSQHGHLAAQALLAQALGVQPEKQNARWRHARAEPLHERSRSRPPTPAEVLAPVGAAPDLVPVDDQRDSAPSGRTSAGGEQREVRERTPCGRRRSGGRGAAGASSTPSAEDERRQDPAPAAGVYSAIRGPAVDDPHARVEVGLLAALPLAQRQVGDLVALGREALGEVAIPALGAADGVGEQAVVDDADAHRA